MGRPQRLDRPFKRVDPLIFKAESEKQRRRVVVVVPVTEAIENITNRIRVEEMRRESKPGKIPILASRPRTKRLLERVAGVGRIINITCAQRPELEMLQDQI